jgi:hypothetical protein
VLLMVVLLTEEDDEVCSENKFKRVISFTSPVVIRICDAILAFNALWLEGHLEPNCHFVFWNIP